MWELTRLELTLDYVNSSRANESILASRANESILAEILTFGNIVDVEKWANLYDADEQLPEEWTKAKMFVTDEGEQQKF